MPGNRVWVSTFHSLGARLLRQYGDRLGFDRNFTIYDIDDRNKLVKDALEALRHRQREVHPGAHRRAISKAKNQLLTPHAVRADRERLLHADRGAGLPGYEKRLRAANAMDFDDLLYLPALALKHERRIPRRSRRPLPLRADRRIPGHQPRAVRDRQAADAELPEPVRGRRP